MCENIILIGLMRVTALMMYLSAAIGLFMIAGFFKKEKLGDKILVICLIISFFLGLVLGILTGYL